MSKRKMERSLAAAQRRRRRRAAVAATTVGAAAAIAAPGAHASTFTVTNLDDSGPGSLRSAVQQANAAGSPDEIVFQSGLTGTIPVGSEMEVTEELDIRGPGPSTITLDGGDDERILRANVGNASAMSVSGLTLANGSNADAGGALVAYGGRLELSNVVVTGSTAFRGGGVFFSGNDLSVADSRFTGNESEYTGGGIGVDGYGGGPADDALEITGTEVTGNKTGIAGGGIALYDTYVDVLVDSSTISRNEVTGENSDFENGGGIWFEDTYDGHSTVVSNSTVSGNSAPDGGGGISFAENFYGPTEVVNTTVVDNSAASGGGIQFADIENAPFTLNNSTVTGNAGGGVFRGYSATVTGTSAPLEVSSSIVSQNSGADFRRNELAGGDLTIGNSLVGYTSNVTYTADPPGSNITGADPQLFPLADNGGPTQTMLAPRTSPVIDAGLANGLTTDQRGSARTVDVPDIPNTHGSDGTDIGAAELDDIEVDGPQVVFKKKQKVGSSLAVKLQVGAAEDVDLSVFGRIKSKRGIPVDRVDTAVAAGELAKVKLKPRDGKGLDKIKRSLANGKPVKAKLKVLMVDRFDNSFEQKVSIRLKPKGK